MFESFLGPYAEKKTFFHGHTYAGNPLACAAATASMRLLREGRVIEGLPAKIAALSRALEPARRMAHVGEVRQRGLMVGIELVRDRATKEEYDYELRAGHQVTQEARKLGAILRPLGNVVVLMPPLAMTEGELEELAAIALAGIERVTARIYADLMMRGLFVTATDTGVGKTEVTCALVANARAAGVDAVAMKPAQSGVTPGEPTDAERLHEAAGRVEPLEVLCPYSFAAPLAPAVAARLEGRTVSLGAIVDRVRALAARHEAVLVEGAGGLLVPLTERRTPTPTSPSRSACRCSSSRAPGSAR